jgi:hypothetical protein
VSTITLNVEARAGKGISEDTTSWQEWHKAAKRDGITPALSKAATRLKALEGMSPEAVEHLFGAASEEPRDPRQPTLRFIGGEFVAMSPYAVMGAELL